MTKTTPIGNPPRMAEPKSGPRPKRASAHGTLPRHVKPVPVRKLPLLTPVVIVWSLSAVLSAGYLLTLATAPHWLSDLTPHGVERAQTATGPSPTEARLVGEVEGLRDDIGRLETELATLRRQATEMRTSLDDEVGSLKAAFAGSTATDDEEDQPPQANAETAPKAAAARADIPPPTRRPKPPATTAAKATPSSPAKTETGAIIPKVINDAKSAGKSAAETARKTIETGSVSSAPAAVAPPTPTTQPVAFSDAVVTPSGSPPPVAVVISNGETVDGLRLSWAALSDRYESVLSGLQPRYMLSGDPSAGSFDLVAGPFASQAEADFTCQKLRADNLPCRIGRFTGNAL